MMDDIDGSDIVLMLGTEYGDPAVWATTFGCTHAAAVMYQSVACCRLLLLSSVRAVFFMLTPKWCSVCVAIDYVVGLRSLFFGSRTSRLVSSADHRSISRRLGVFLFFSLHCVLVQ